MNESKSVFDRIQEELEMARQARLQGNEGKARVCARRAAGLAASHFLAQKGVPNPGTSALACLQSLTNQPEISTDMQEIISHFLLTVSHQHSLPQGIDLIAESRLLLAYLLSMQNK